MSVLILVGSVALVASEDGLGVKADGLRIVGLVNLLLLLGGHLHF